MTRSSVCSVGLHRPIRDDSNASGAMLSTNGSKCNQYPKTHRTRVQTSSKGHIQKRIASNFQSPASKAKSTDSGRPCEVSTDSNRDISSRRGSRGSGRERRANAHRVGGPPPPLPPHRGRGAVSQLNFRGVEEASATGKSSVSLFQCIFT